MTAPQRPASNSDARKRADAVVAIVRAKTLTDIAATLLEGITVDMSADYCRLAEWRTNDRNQLAKVLGHAKTEAPDEHQLDLFGEATA